MTKKPSEKETGMIPQKALAKATGTRSTELPEGVTDVGAAIRSALPGLKATEEKFAKHCQDIREQMRRNNAIEMCAEHPDVALPVNWDATYGHSWKYEKLTPIYMECPQCEKEKAASIVNDRWINKCGVPHKVAHATVEGFIVDDEKAEHRASRIKVKEKVRQHFLKRGGGFLIFLGNFGTGKSFMGAALLKRYTSREHPDSVFITMADLIGALRTTYSEGTSADSFVERYRNAKVFVLDELTTEVKGTDVAPLLYRILAERYDKGLLTILTSNEDLATVKQILGPRLVDRMRENFTVCNFTWESARKAA